MLWLLLGGAEGRGKGVGVDGDDGGGGGEGVAARSPEEGSVEVQSASASVTGGEARMPNASHSIGRSRRKERSAYSRRGSSCSSCLLDAQKGQNRDVAVVKLN